MADTETSDRPERPPAPATPSPYGGADQVVRMLDAVGTTLREEPQALWDASPDLREASLALRDHLDARLRRQVERDR